MTWQLFTLLSVLLLSVFTLLQRMILLDHDSHPKTYAILFQILTGLLLGLFGLITTNMSYAGLKQILPNLALMTFLYGFGNLFVFKALKALEASKFTIIFATSSLFTILASTVFLQEKLLLTQMFGVLLVFLGVIIINIRSAKKMSFSKKEGLGLMAAASFGFAVTNDRVILNTLNLYPFLFIGFTLPGLFLALVNLKVVKKMKAFLNQKTLLRILMISAVYALAAIAFYSGLQLAPNSSQVASIALTRVIVTILLAIIFLKERKDFPQKLLAAIVSFIGLLLINLN